MTKNKCKKEEFHGPSEWVDEAKLFEIMDEHYKTGKKKKVDKGL